MYSFCKKRDIFLKIYFSYKKKFAQNSTNYTSIHGFFQKRFKFFLKICCQNLKNGLYCLHKKRTPSGEKGNNMDFLTKKYVDVITSNYAVVFKSGEPFDNTKHAYLFNTKEKAQAKANELEKNGFKVQGVVTIQAWEKIKAEQRKKKKVKRCIIKLLNKVADVLLISTVFIMFVMIIFDFFFGVIPWIY